MRKFAEVLGLTVSLLALASSTAWADQWIYLEAPIKLGTKAARTTFDESAPLKDWAWRARTDSEASCKARMAEAVREQEETSRMLGKTLGVSEEQARAGNAFLNRPRLCLRESDPRLR
jgi:hypothetical protein